MKFIITWPQIQSSLFISALVSTFNPQLGNLKKDLSAQEEEEEKKVQDTETATVTGSISAQLGYSNPYVYDQFSLKTIEQRINQIVLLQVGTCFKKVQ